MVDIGNIQVPTSFVVARHDKIVDIKDAAWTIKQMNEEYLRDVHEIDGGHGTFMVGNDMSYVNEVIAWIDEINQ